MIIICCWDIKCELNIIWLRIGLLKSLYTLPSLTITKFNPLNFVQPLKQVTQNYIFLYGKIKYYISILFAIKMMTTHPAWFMDEGKITNSTGLKYSKNLARMFRCLLFLKWSTFSCCSSFISSFGAQPEKYSVSIS